MADENESVKYTYEGDVSSLRDATSKAVSLLGEYENAIKKAASQDSFKASRTSVAGLQRAINSLTTQTNALVKVINSVGTALDSQIPEGASAVTGATKQIADTLEYLGSVSGATSEDLKLVTSVVKDISAIMGGVASKATALGTSLKTASTVAKQGSDEIKASVDKEAEAVKTASSTSEKYSGTVSKATFRVQEAYEASGKSAAESARVFASTGSVFERIQVEATILGNTIKQQWDSIVNKTASLTSRLQSFKSSASEAFESVRGSASRVASIFSRQASEAGKSEEAFDDLSKKSKNLNSNFSDTTSGATKLISKLKSLSTQTTKLSTSTKALSSATSILSKAFTLLTGVSVGDWLASSIKESISYIENLNLFTVAMGEAIDTGNEFVATMQELYGMDPSNIMKYAGNFYQLASAIEMPEAAATNISLGLTKAANDISSLFNVDIATVYENLSSGMQGMSRAVRKYGMDIRTTTLQQTALSLGITEQVENMSEANRMGLRYLTMMKQAANATGDFARTIETPANQLKIFKEQITQLGRAIGNFFITPLATAISYVNGFVMALRTMLTFIAETLNLVDSTTSSLDTSSAEDAADAVSGIGSAAEDASDQMKKLIAPFDELNVLQESTSAGAAGGGLDSTDIMDPAIAEAIANMEVKFENIKMKANEVRDSILEFLGFEVDFGKIISWDPKVFEDNLINKFPGWTKTIQATFDNWSDIVQGFKNVFSSLGEVFSIVKEKLKDFISIFINDDTVSEFISNLADNLNKLSGWISEHSEELANFVLTLIAIKEGFKALQIVSALIGPISEFIAVCADALSPFAEVIAVAAILVGTIALLYSNSEEFAKSFDNLINTVLDSIKPILESITNLLENVWKGIKELWNKNIKPLIKKTGDALAPVLDSISTLWDYTSQIISDAINLISTLWDTTLQPVFAAIFDAIGNIMDIVKTVWEEVVGPIIGHVTDGLYKLWNNTIKPIIQKVIEIIGGLIELLLALWDNELAPRVDWVIRSLGPSIKNVVNTIWDIVSSVIGSILEVIEGLLTTIKGVIDFLVGVFTGDWERAWKGIANIFIGLGNSIISAFEAVVNAIIGLINGTISLAYNYILGFINAVLGAVESIGELLGKDLNLRITAAPPAIPTQSWGRIPELATGGIVTNPTYLLAGEGSYSEAIIPLDNSPQMQDLVQQIADAVDKKPSETPVQVIVYIGDEEFDAYTYKASERGKKKVGAQPVKTGG